MWNIKKIGPSSKDLAVVLESVGNNAPLGFEQSVAKGRGIEFLGLREFQNTDSARDVDWMASARLAGANDVDLVVREFAPEHQIHVLVIADECETMLYPKKKPLHATAILHLLGRATFASENLLAVVGVGKDTIYSDWLSNEQDLGMFLDSADGAKRTSLRSPLQTLPELLETLKLKNTLIVFITDLASTNRILLSALNALDLAQSITPIVVVLDEWSGFIPTHHAIALQNPENGKIKVFDMRRGGSIEREVYAFHERVRVLRERGKAYGLSVMTVPLVEEWSLKSFYKQWERHISEQS